MRHFDKIQITVFQKSKNVSFISVIFGAKNQIEFSFLLSQNQKCDFQKQSKV